MLQSYAKHHPQTVLQIYLVDEWDQSVNYQEFSPAEVIKVDAAVVPVFDEMVSRYSILELNSDVRPFIFQYIAKQYSQYDKVFYADPDMYVYGEFTEAEELLNNYDLIITPHITEPIPVDGKQPFEDLANRYGIYNVGFIVMKPQTTIMQQFLEWWGERTLKFGFNDVERGLFTDQIWFNLVPLFFERVKVLKHKGYNMAIWNLHERRLTRQGDDQYKLQNGEELKLYHFSNWNYFEPGVLSKGLDRFSFDNRPDLVEVYKEYHRRLRENEMDRYRAIACKLKLKSPKSRSGIKKALSPGVDALKKVWQKI